MKLEDALAGPVRRRRRRLDEQRRFEGKFDLAVPLIDRAHLTQNIDASREFFLDQRPGDPRRQLPVRGRDIEKDDFGHVAGPHHAA